MRVYHFSEQPYLPGWDMEVPSLRVTLPNRACDPAEATRLFARYYDEWMLADELGLDIMVNEHHSTATCLSVSAGIALGILARQTRRARLLALGVPIANRRDPVRVAEELSLIDCISGGRLEMGLVRGVPYELAPANSNPVRMVDRFWEAHDLILKAMTSHDGPFSWEGEFFNERSVNIWPRPVQQPHPPVWITTSSPASTRQIAERGHVMATILTGWRTRQLYDLYRAVRAELGHPPPGPDRFAYCCFLSVADSDALARRRASVLMKQLRGPIAEHLTLPPGYSSLADAVKVMKQPAGSNSRTRTRAPTRDGREIRPLHDASVDDYIDAGMLFCGTPDVVHRQITEFCDAAGGIGHLLVQFQGGSMDHAETVNNLTLFAREVLPRLHDLRVPEPCA